MEIEILSTKYGNNLEYYIKKHPELFKTLHIRYGISLGNKTAFIKLQDSDNLVHLIASINKPIIIRQTSKGVFRIKIYDDCIENH